MQKNIWVGSLLLLAAFVQQATAGEHSGLFSLEDWDTRLLDLQAEDPTEPAPSSTNSQEAEPQPATSPQVTSDSDVPEASPFSFEVTYWLYSDYVFRGSNFSEFVNEGRERPNHQVTTSIGVDVAGLLQGDTGSLGTFEFATFFEWFGGQDQIDPQFGEHNLQEVDYTLSWGYDIEPVATTFTLGCNFYTFPNHKEINSLEWFVQLDHNDAWMWKWLWPDNEDGVLNPYLLYAHDVKYAAGGKWLEIGISHDFEVARDLTLTPSFAVAGEHHYYSRNFGLPESGSGQLAYVQYGISADYDLASAMEWPDEAGSWVVSTFLTFNEALGALSESNTINDELFGGMSVTWSF